MHWNSTDSLFNSDTIKQFDGAEEAKELLEVLKERLSNSGHSEDLSKLIRHVKLLYLFEVDNHPWDSLGKKAEEYRQNAFHRLDWIPALEKNSRQIFANVFLQIGIQFQQAAKLENQPFVQMADERLALKLYLTAVGVASHCTPDVEIYINSTVIQYLSAFIYQEKMLKDILQALKERTFNTVDVFPFFEVPQSNIVLFKEDNKTLKLMRHLLSEMVKIYQYNQSNSPGISLDHSPVTVLYQAYEACLKNWYQEVYNPAIEHQFRLELMDELLFEKGFTFLEVEERLTSPWVMVDRNDDGWLTPTRSLPYPTDINLQVFSSLTGAEINFKTGNIQFYLMPWHPNSPVYEKLFTLHDLQQMLEKNIGGAIFSLDPVDANKPYHPFNQMRFSPERLLECELLNTMLLTDYILKFLTTAQEVQGTYPFDQKSVNSMIEHLPAYLRAIIESFQNAPHSGSLHRFWIEAEEIDVYTDEEIKGKNEVARISLDNLKMVLKKHRMVRDIQGELKDTSNDEEGWPIYVLSPKELQELEQGNRTLEGPAMLFNRAVAELFYWENNAILKSYFPSRDCSDTLMRLYNQPREANGKVIVNTKNMPLIYRVTTTMAEFSGMSHRYSPEFIFAHQFTTHYDEFAQYLPEFGRLKELSKITVLIRYLHGIRLSNRESLDALDNFLNPTEPLSTNPTNPFFTDRKLSKSHTFVHYSENAKTIHLAGNFNNWLYGSDEWLMKNKGNGKWKIKVELAPGKYEFKYLINKATWEKDLKYTSDNKSNHSILHIVEGSEAHQIYKNEEERIHQDVAASFSKWRETLPSLAELAPNNKKKIQEDISQYYPGNSMNDILHALEADAAAIKRIGLQESKNQFEQQKNQCLKLATGLADIHFGEEEEEQEIDLT
nr:hypothetical protein [Tatlockia sp.]